MKPTLSETTQTRIETPSFAQAIRVWAKIGLMSFGGPAAQIALMHQIIVEQYRWMSEKDYLNALSFCLLLPGPEAMQLATYAGWKLHGKLGGLLAGLLFVLPGAIIILALAIIYAVLGHLPILEALFLGVKAAVLVIVIEALLRISKRVLKKSPLRLLALCSFIGIFFFNIPYPLIVLFAATVGFLFADKKITQTESIPEKPKGLRQLVLTISLLLCLWFFPLILIDQLSNYSILGEIGAFFSRLAVVTFGGAYAVLAYMGQDVVNQWGWLSTGEMMDGLGLAETTPGPLILVTEFVAFLAAFKEGGIGLGLAGAGVALWVTFVPCFLWIFAGAPYIEWITAQPKLNGALESISAAVVGVILNLTVWFSLHVLFASIIPVQNGWITLWKPEWMSVDWRVLVLFMTSATLAFKFHWSIISVLSVAAMLGLVLVRPF